MLYTTTINNNKDYLSIYKKAEYTAGKYVVIYVRKNNLPFNRLGITAGKKVGGAVERNRAKRLIRQVYRTHEIELPVGIDIVIVARNALTEIKCQILDGYMVKKGIPEIKRIAERFKK